ncbi:hypothetical protein [Paenibacillus apiarius]|uniref:hypothetical protein n=1 Tax=Paenibacillus apiarius TaxID=46240 RepID=UPI00197DD7A3|nr:hypothetical protein [Paenibacillus apiarius]MBN3525181.1 hypothetical protein [Paenibacillus apiarius]
MKKTFLLVLSCFAFLSISSSGFAAEDDFKKMSLEKVNTTQHEILGEKFELITWKDDKGNLIHTIPTKVKNKQAVAGYADEIIKNNTEEKIVPLGTVRNWSHNLKGSSTDSRINWKISGYNEEAYLYPITTNKMKIHDGIINTHYMGSGNADKIVVSYSYTFSGTTISISYPPALEKKENKVSWTSLPIENQWYAVTESHGAEGNSRTFLHGTDIETSADIYKGSLIYRPRITKHISYPLEESTE